MKNELNLKKSKPIIKNHKPSGFTLMEIVVVLAVFSTTALMATDLFLSVTRVQRQVRGVQAVQSDARFALEAMAKEARNGTIDYGYYGAVCQGGNNPGDPCPNGNLEGDECNGGTCASIDLTTENPIDILVTRDQDNNQIFYKLNGDLIEVCSNSHLDLTRCNTKIYDPDSGNWQDQDNWQTVTPPSVKVNKLDFYIFPPVNPFSTEAISCLQPSDCSPGTCGTDGFCTYDFQPTVTFVLESVALNEKGEVEEGGEKVNLQTTVTSMFYKR